MFVKVKKQMWWYMQLVIKFLEIAACNAYILDGYVHVSVRGPGSTTCTFLKSRRSWHWLAIPEHPRRHQGTKDPLLNVGCNFPVKGEGKNHQCVVCLEKLHGDGDNVPNSAKTTFKCTECDVYLCILKEHNCFKKYQTQVEFWRDTVADNNSSDSEHD